MTWVYTRFNIKLNLHGRRVDNYYNIILWYSNMFMCIGTHLAHNVYIYIYTLCLTVYKTGEYEFAYFCNRHRRFLFRKYYFFCARGYIVPCATLIRYLLPTYEKIIRLSVLVYAHCVYIFS
jgi:hypothetical protein